MNPGEVCEKLRPLSFMPEQPYFDKNFEKEIEIYIENFFLKDADALDDVISEILNRDIEVEEIVLAVKKLKCGRAPGLDRIPVEFVKCCIHTIKYDLHFFV